MNSINELNSRFSIPDALQFEAGGGGLTRAVISTPLASGHVYLHGAHVTHYECANETPLLFLSSKTNFTTKHAIRGGVPICFPWFGTGKDGAAPLFHGFARTSEWEVESATKTPGEAVKLALALTPNDAIRAMWPHEFKARYTITMGSELRLTLEISNTGTDAFEFEEALHTYLQVADIRRADVTGLEATEYLDKVQDMKKGLQDADPITFPGETDRIYLNTVSTCVANDRVAKRKISVAKDASNTTVVWTPGPIKGREMTDMGVDDWTKMLCIETCNVKVAAIIVQPLQSHKMSATISAI